MTDTSPDTPSPEPPSTSTPPPARRVTAHGRAVAADGRTYTLAADGPPPASLGGLGHATTWDAIPPFPKAAPTSIGDATMRRNLAFATSTIRGKRVAVVAERDDWEQLRDAGAAIKDRVLHRLDHYLVQAEEALTRAGATVHWARDAAEANRIVTGIVKATGETGVVKVKSMVTQEIGLNEHLAEHGITAYETDLAELIVQLADDLPSHLLVPAIHRNRDEIQAIFTAAMADAPEGLSNEPADLAAAARTHLRQKFLAAKVAVSGANFLVAETGTLVVMESEGNGRMCLTLPDTLISVVGIEKLVPTMQDLEVVLQLLPRSSTGERQAPYVSTWTGVTPGDGPQTVHVVLLDNGRTNVLADEVGRQALRCIRCSACLNVCPVYERTGGHAYGSVYPGPIGAILTPQLRGPDAFKDKQTQALPFASTLCGACNEVCPVRIRFTDVLTHLRAKVREEKRGLRHGDFAEKASLGATGFAFNHPVVWGTGLRLGMRPAHALTPKSGMHALPMGLGGWTSVRDVPQPPAQSFRAWWRQHEKERAAGDVSGQGAESAGDGSEQEDPR